MRLWQSAMISLAKSEKVTAAMQASPFMQRFASQFIGGTDASQALDTVTRLRQRGLRTTLFYLGEYIRDVNLVEQCADELLRVLPKLCDVGSDAHISVDPTQMGASIDWSLCVNNIGRLADKMANLATSKRKVLMIDMEDSSLTEATIELWHSLHARGYPVAITIQAYLRRSERDICRLVEAGAAVRLVKGALAESQTVAYRTRADIDANYRALTDILLSDEAMAKGVYPSFGTHDEAIIAYVIKRAEANEWPQQAWEFEMLFGVRETLQRKLLTEGRSLRLYMPFGKNFWAYSIRRVGESPQNLQFVLRAMREVMGTRTE